MKRVRKSVALTLALVSVLIICASPTQAQATRTVAHAIMSCDPATIHGSITTRDGMMFWRDVHIMCYLTSEDPRARGWCESHNNANLDATGSGPAWGTCDLYTYDGGVWYGKWHQHWSPTLNVGSAVASGDGTYRGQIAFLTFNNSDVTWEFLETGSVK
jgi:hypothetical protein